MYCHYTLCNNFPGEMGVQAGMAALAWDNLLTMAKLTCMLVAGQGSLSSNL
jgi:hypothetical protein